MNKSCPCGRNSTDNKIKFKKYKNVPYKIYNCHSQLSYTTYDLKRQPKDLHKK